MAFDAQNLLLILNSGSSSVKFSVFSCQPGNQEKLAKEDAPQRIFNGQIEHFGSQANWQLSDAKGQIENKQGIKACDQQQALTAILQWLDHQGLSSQLLGVGHRIVHGGAQYRQSVLVSDAVLADLEALTPLAPNHQPANLQAIKLLATEKANLPQVACFDTAFHATRPAVEQRFALPDTPRFKQIRRYGFHGLSYEYISRELKNHFGEGADGKVIVAHLGGGASLCALRDRKSIATTMTFTPLDGLPMATRCGSIDPAVVLYLQQQQGMSLQQVSDLLYFESGLLGVSGSSGDVKALLKQDTDKARFALDLFVHHTVRSIGSLAAALGGLDALVFTGGIGEHASSIRASIVQQCAWLGISLDETANQQHGPRISTKQSTASAWVIPTDEERMIAHHSWSIIKDL